MKYLRSPTFGCRDIGIRKSEFVADTQFLRLTVLLINISYTCVKLEAKPYSEALVSSSLRNAMTEEKKNIFYFERSRDLYYQSIIIDKDFMNAFSKS